MSTPADGGSPRMQMYLFDGLVTGEFQVLDPASLAGKLTFGTAAFGPQSFDLTGTLQLVDDGVAPPPTPAPPPSTARRWPARSP
jgi:hypothetical protein